MSAPKSFISYMKIMREHYKSGATHPDPALKNFNFNDIELDASAYGFISNGTTDNNQHKSEKNNLTSINTTAHTLPENSAKQTKITTIALFDQDHRLSNTALTSPAQRKSLLKSSKIKGIFSCLFSALSKGTK